MLSTSLVSGGFSDPITQVELFLNFTGDQQSVLTVEIIQHLNTKIDGDGHRYVRVTIEESQQQAVQSSEVRQNLT